MKAFLVRGETTLYLFKIKRFNGIIDDCDDFKLPFEWFPELEKGKVAEIEIELKKIT